MNKFVCGYEISGNTAHDAMNHFQYSTDIQVDGYVYCVPSKGIDVTIAGLSLGIMTFIFLLIGVYVGKRIERGDLNL